MSNDENGILSPNFGKVVKARLVELGKTHVWLMRELGISRQYFYDILDGKRQANAQRLRMFQILGIKA